MTGSSRSMCYEKRIIIHAMYRVLCIQFGRLYDSFHVAPNVNMGVEFPRSNTVSSLRKITV